MKGTWSLVNAAYSVARAQADLDKSIGALIKSMDDGCKLAKDYAPLKGRNSGTDSITQEILKEVISGANIIKVYCEKRPKRMYPHKEHHDSCLAQSWNIFRSFRPPDSQLDPRARSGGVLNVVVGVRTKASHSYGGASFRPDRPYSGCGG